MSAREWEPGDVAIHDSHGYRSIFVSSCRIGEHGRDGNACWHNESGLSDPPTSPRRPLVVIDPEDREQVERLARAFRDDLFAVDDIHPGMAKSADSLQAALREFANPTPPKPEEPLGLGAVVEDAFGHTFIRLSTTWFNINEGQHCNWDHIAAARVLSEGVTP